MFIEEKDILQDIISTDLQILFCENGYAVMPLNSPTMNSKGDYSLHPRTYVFHTKKELADFLIENLKEANTFRSF